MISTIVTHATDFAQAVPAAGNYGTGGLQGWIKDNVVPLIILLAAVAVMWAGRGGNISKGVTVLAGIILGVVVLGLATGTTASDVGEFLVGLFKK